MEFVKLNRNALESDVSWRGVCYLSRLLTKGMKEKHGEAQIKKDLCYISTVSLGNRDVSGIVCETLENTPFKGFWKGYSESSSKNFEWGSTRSGAKLHATKINKNQWNLLFVGCNTVDYQRESYYLKIFIRVINVEELITYNIVNSEKIISLVEEEINKNKEDVDKFHLFKKYFNEQLANSH